MLALVGIGVWLLNAARTTILAGAPDFEYFYKAGAWLRNSGSLDPGYDLVGGRVVRRGMLDWYWPFVPRVMTLLASLPYRVAGFIWLAINLAALVATVRLLGRHLSGLPPADWPVTQLVPLLILLAYWTWEFRLNQINNLTLLLLVGSFACWEHGRRGLAGFWLGISVLLKLTPVLLLFWFVLKRQYRTVGVAVLTVVLAGPVADVLALGSGQALDAYQAWLRRAVTTGSHRGLVLAQCEMDWRNQGLGAVLSRWLHPTSYNTRFDNDPRIQAAYGATAPLSFNVVALPLPVVANLATGVVAATLIGLFWLARRPASRLTAWELRLEWALFVLAMLWLMPVMRRYHMIWALPVLSVVGGMIHYCGFGSRWSKLALTCVGLTVVAQLALLVRPLEAAGSVLGCVVALAVPPVVMLRRLQRRPDALPEPFYGRVTSSPSAQPCLSHNIEPASGPVNAHAPPASV